METKSSSSENIELIGEGLDSWIQSLSEMSGDWATKKQLKPSHAIVAGGSVPELDALFDNIVYYPNYSQRLTWECDDVTDAIVF